jgi:hypothetical protein
MTKPMRIGSQSCSFPARAPGPGDMAMAFRVFLGRETAKPEDLLIPPGLGWRGFFLRFLGSDEFVVRVLPHLLAGTQPRAMPAADSGQIQAMADWVAGLMQGPGRPQAEALAASGAWSAMMSAWLANPDLSRLLDLTAGTAEREVTAAWVLDQFTRPPG